MKSRRELISGLLIDLVKTMFVTFVIGKVVNPGLVTWTVMMIGMIATMLILVCAVKIHPKTEIDKELGL